MMPASRRIAIGARRFARRSSQRSSRKTFIGHLPLRAGHGWSGIRPERS
jgi:hypothetical protein